MLWIKHSVHFLCHVPPSEHSGTFICGKGNSGPDVVQKFKWASLIIKTRHVYKKTIIQLEHVYFPKLRVYYAFVICASDKKPTFKYLQTIFLLVCNVLSDANARDNQCICKLADYVIRWLVVDFWALAIFPWKELKWRKFAQFKFLSPPNID